MANIVTRFAPSPTGNLHIGGVRTALFSYLFAQKNSGKFLLRIEDTDKARNKKEYEEDIINGLKILGINWDNNPVYRQSEHLALYRRHIEKLIKEDKAYVSKEIPTEDGESYSAPTSLSIRRASKASQDKRDEVIRLRNVNKDVKFNDMVHGEIIMNTSDLGDIVIAKTIDEPIFHFANVIDDHEMGVTHIIRGEEHLSNTPRQILIHEALELSQPLYAHIPLVLAADRSKLSKRQGSVSLKEFLENGYLPEGLVNYLALLGWHPEDNSEIFTLAELVEKFDLSRVQKGGAIWNTEKLDWVNKEHLKKMNYELRIMNYGKELEKCKIENYKKEILEKIEPIITERINKFGDIKEMSDRGELQFFFSQPIWKKEEFLWKGEGEVGDVIKRLKEVTELLGGLDEKNFTKEFVKNAIWPYADREGRGQVLWPTRYALSGMPKSADPFTIAEVVGKQETIARLNAAINFLNV